MAATTFIFLLFILLICSSCQVKESVPEGMISNHASVTNKFTISAPTSKTYVAGETVTLILNFPFDIDMDNSGGDPRLVLNVGGVLQYATLVPQANTKQLHFSYMISPGEVDADGIDLMELDLNGSTLKFTYLGISHDCDTTTCARKNFFGLKVNAT